ncbi:MAG TPA: MFS transporter, partial [Propionibacteriaceae bacterium]|nr:MFS transporter [Propionibacteriaceae bacterium]
ALLGLARQAYVTDVVPLEMRARALSTLGGVFRIGAFIGPILGAAVVSAFDLKAAYLMGAATSLLGALVTLAIPDLVTERPTTAEAVTGSMGQVLKDNAFVYLTQGLGAAAIMVVRTAKDG